MKPLTPLRCFAVALVAAFAISGSAAAQPIGAEPEPQPLTYQVQSGDTLTAIAQRFNTSVARLLWRNRISEPDYLVAGFTLRLSGPRRDSKAPAPPRNTAGNISAPDVTPTPEPTSSGGWWPTIMCESGGDPYAYNPAGPYMGLLQFDQQTWEAFGGSGTPMGKGYAETVAVAERVTYDAWPNC